MPVIGKMISQVGPVSENNDRTAGAIVVEKVETNKGLNPGFNAEAEKSEGLVASGVIDPRKVTRTSFQNASSISALLLIPLAHVCDIKEIGKKPAGLPGGGMGGMH